MSRCFILGIVCSVCTILPSVAERAEDPATLISQAADAYKAKDYATSARLYEQAIEAGASRRLAAFNAGCCYALLGKTDDAFTWLEKACDAGWRDVDHLRADADLKSLQADPRWQQTVKRCEAELAKFVKTLKEPSLREELLKRFKEDQRIRMARNPNMREWMKIDADNPAFMKKTIETHGWPGNSMVGVDGAQAAFMLVQHAASDRG